MLYQYRAELADLKLTTDPKVLDRIKVFPEEDRPRPTGRGMEFPDPLLNVAPKVVLTGFGPNPILMDFHLTPTADLKYPTDDMRKALLAERTKPVGTPLVLADAPKDTYYVAVVLHRDVRSPETFKREVYAPRGGPNARAVGQQLRVVEQAEAFKAARDSVLGLLKKEFKYAETEEQAKKLDQSDRAETAD